MRPSRAHLAHMGIGCWKKSTKRNRPGVPRRTGLRPHTRRNPHKRKPERVRMPPSPGGGMRKRKLISNCLFRIAKNQRAGIKKTAQSWQTFIAASEPSICVFISASAHALSTVRGVALLRKRRVNYPHKANLLAKSILRVESSNNHAGFSISAVSVVGL